jgi:hypothetical protein
VKISKGSLCRLVPTDEHKREYREFGFTEPQDVVVHKLMDDTALVINASHYATCPLVREGISHPCFCPEEPEDVTRTQWVEKSSLTPLDIEGEEKQAIDSIMREIA